MRHRSKHVVLAVTLLTLVGCGPHVRVTPVGSDYTLVSLERMNPDHHPGTALHYRGKEVWANVYGGSGKSHHEGIFVFSAPVPTSDGQYNYSISPQVFAIYGAGPPIIISQRIVSDTLDSQKRYRLWQLTPIENGVRVEFHYWADQDHEAQMTREVSWTNIQSWVQEAEASAPKKTTPLGTYRILPP